MILYTFIAENKINVSVIISNNSSFYCLIKENEGKYEEILVGNLLIEQKEDIINNIELKPEIPDFFKTYIKNKILLF